MNTKKLYRSKTDRMLFGVAGGLAEYFGVDSNLVRIIFIILTIWGGVGLLLYIVGIFLIPENPSGVRSTAKNQKEKNKAVEERVNAVASKIKEKIEEHRNGKSALSGEQIFGLVVLLIGLIFLSNTLFSYFNFWRLWPLVLVVIGLVILLGKKRRPNNDH